jgi:hypothetical protein
MVRQCSCELISRAAQRRHLGSITSPLGAMEARRCYNRIDARSTAETTALRARTAPISRLGMRPLALEIGDSRCLCARWTARQQQLSSASRCIGSRALARRAHVAGASTGTRVWRATATSHAWPTAPTHRTVTASTGQSAAQRRAGYRIPVANARHHMRPGQTASMARIHCVCSLLS